MTPGLATALHAVAQQAAGHQQYPAATLYVVATPIGNLADLTLRAVHVLGLADAIACEDTRHTAGLLRHLGLDKPLLALHAHNERDASQRVVGLLEGGQRVALVCDAGTPAVSDPGAALVAAVTRAGRRVVPIPGPSSAIAAASVAGDAGASGFRFRGFLPARGGERRAALQACADDDGMQLLFEAPHRIDALLDDLAEDQPDRTLTLCRELTKQFESIHTLPARQAPTWLAEDANRQRGEFVVVLHARSAGTDDLGQASADALRILKILLQELPLKQAVALAATISAAPRNGLYAAALAMRNDAAKP